MPVFSFIDQNDLSGKVILPFVTHGGGWHVKLRRRYSC